jgi:hypothetical protein
MIQTRFFGIAMVACATLAGYSAAAQPDLNGVWLIDKKITELRPSDGTAVPLTDWSKALYEKNKALRMKGDMSFDTASSLCASPGAARMMTLSYPIEIFQRPFQVTLLFQWNHLYRLINMPSQPKEAPYPLAIGVSNGHWEGDTLVVKTTTMTGNTLLDSSGLPHSDQLQLTERIRLKGPGQLENVIALHDPKAFSRDWSATLTYKKTAAVGIDQDICLDRVENGQPAFP